MSQEKWKELRLLELPPRHEKLGIVNTLNMKSEYMHFKTVSTPVVNLQQVELGNVPQQRCTLKEMAMNRRENLNQHVDQISNELPKQFRHPVELAQEKGSSSWLTTLPLQQHGFCLHKSEFRGTLCLRCGLRPVNLSDH